MEALADVSQHRRKIEATASSIAVKSAAANARLAQDSRDAAEALLSELRARREARLQGKQQQTQQQPQPPPPPPPLPRKHPFGVVMADGNKGEPGDSIGKTVLPLTTTPSSSSLIVRAQARPADAVAVAAPGAGLTPGAKTSVIGGGVHAENALQGAVCVGSSQRAKSGSGSVSVVAAQRASAGGRDPGLLPVSIEIRKASVGPRVDAD